MQAERRVSGGFVEFLFSRARGTELADAFRKVGLNLDEVQSDYPVERLQSGLELLSKDLHPEKTRGEALRQLGFDLIKNKKKKYDGRSFDEAMTRLPESFGHVGNFLGIEVHPSKSGYVATMDDVACLHTFFLGMLEAVTTSTSTQKHQVVWSPAGLSGARYEVRVPSQG